MKHVTEIAQIFLIIAAFGAILYLVPANKDVQPISTDPPDKMVSASKSTSHISKQGTMHQSQ